MTETSNPIEQTIEMIHDIGDDTQAMTQQESLDFYAAIAADATTMANLIRSEMRAR